MNFSKVLDTASNWKPLVKLEEVWVGRIIS